MLILEMSITVCRQSIKLAGSTIFSKGICVRICNVLIKFQISFIDKPRNKERATLTMTP